MVVISVWVSDRESAPACGVGTGREGGKLHPPDLACGVHPKVVFERLGHASIGITLDAYSHVMPGMQEEAAEKIAVGLRKALVG